MSTAPLVANAADAGQVRHARRKDKDAAQVARDDLRFILSDQRGRRFLWSLMGWTGYLENPTHARGDMTHQNIGRADVGRKLLADILEADEKSYLTMQAEARLRDKSDRVEAEALRTKRAGEEE